MKKIIALVMSAVMMLTFVPTSFASTAKKLAKPTFTVSVSKEGNPVIKITKASKDTTHFAIYRLNQKEEKYTRITYSPKATFTDNKWDVNKSGDAKYRIQAVTIKNKKIVNKSDITGAKSTSAQKTTTVKTPEAPKADDDEDEEIALPETPAVDVIETTLLYQGHGSLRITAKNGTVIYVDPYAGEGYDVPADIILVTHQHSDHNQVQLVTKKDDCVTITNSQAVDGVRYSSFNVKGVNIQAVSAFNENHNVRESVGYIITVDGIKIYVAGDTSKTPQMERFAAMKLDYALLPADGVYNMDLKEAAECAKIIGAKHNIPYHLKPGELFDREAAEKFDAPNRLIVEAGEEIVLTN